MDRILQDLRFAFRQLRRSPGFAVLAIITLALGIGANTAIFSVVNGVVLRPLPYPEPDRVVYLRWDWGGGPRGALNAHKFAYWRENSRVFDAVATMNTVTVEVDIDGASGDVEGLSATGDFLRTLGIPPALGRDFLPEETAPGGPLVAILGHDLWTERLVADPDVIGTSLRVNGVAREVVGVLAPGFRYVPSPSANGILLPMQLEADPRDRGHNYSVIARLSRGVSMDQARADMESVFRQYQREHPELIASETENGVGFLSFRDVHVGDLQRTLWVLLAAVGLVLLIACVNVANLLMTRATARSREIATRVALGAGRGRIVSQILTESMVLAGIAGAIGLLLGLWSLDLVLALLPEALPRIDEIGLDIRVLAFTLLAAVATGLAFGLAAALPASRPQLSAVIKEGSPGSGSSRGFHARGALIAGEVALSLVLLAGAGLLVNSFLQLRGVDKGFEPRDVVTFNLGAARDGYATGAEIASLERQVTERIGALPAVRGVAAAPNLPLQRGWNIPIALEGRPGEGESAIEYRAVSPDYFSTLEIPLVRGRAFSEAERTAASAPVAIINEATAREYWPESDPIGQRIIIAEREGESILPGDPDPAREIVGVVGDIREIGLDVPPQRTVYVPQAQAHPALVTGLPQFMIRTDRPGEVMQATRLALSEIDPRLREPSFSTMDDVVAVSIAQDRFNTLLVGSFAALALILTMIGIFGVVSFTVRQRTREIGIRMALGANHSAVRRMIVSQGMKAVLVGVLIGLAGSFALTRFMSGMLFGVEPGDPATFLIVSALLVGVALIASWIPARRATRIDPILALRSE